MDGLRAEEAQLRQAASERARLISADGVRVQQTHEGKPLYSLQQLDQAPRAKFRAQPVYPADLKNIGVGGEALMEFTVRPDGTIGDIKAVKSTHDAFAEAAQEALAKWKFAPGQISGVPVNVRVQQPFVFATAKDGISDWF